MSDAAEQLGCLTILLIIAFFVWIGPMIFIWGANFILGEMGLALIPITLKSWFGSFLIGLVLGGSKVSSSSK